MGWGVRWILPASVSIALLAVPPIALSQSSSPVIQLLLNARDVRTRVQAATTLGRLRPPGARQALESAMSDDNPAVRAAAAQALMNLGDPAALPALRSHANDSDPGVRAGVAQAVQTLQGSAGVSVAMAPPSSGSPMMGAPVNWSHTRYAIRLGNLTNRAGGRAGLVDVLRNAIVQEASRGGEMAVVSGALPPEIERRVRAGQVHSYALEGGVNTLRTWTVANTLSVRAEVSLVLMSDPGRAMVGSMTGAATAQDRTPPYDAAMFEQRLQDRALVGAVHGAMGNLQRSLP
jgi:hypothetical protein